MQLFHLLNSDSSYERTSTWIKCQYRAKNLNFLNNYVQQRLLFSFNGESLNSYKAILLSIFFVSSWTSGTSFMTNSSSSSDVDLCAGSSPVPPDSYDGYSFSNSGEYLTSSFFSLIKILLDSFSYFSILYARQNS